MAVRKLKPIEERDPYAARVLDAFDRTKVSCPACGATDYEGDLMECPHCGAGKCSRCDMGDDASCINCENT